jgi:undecaprenyl-diphosphatase
MPRHSEPFSHAGQTVQAEPGWAAFAAAQHTWRRFQADCRALPKATWRCWAGTLVAGAVVTALLALGLTLLARLMEDRGLREWDARMLLLMAERAPLTFSQSVTWQSPGNLVCMLAVVLTAVIALARASRPLLASSLALAYALGTAFVWIGWGLWDRPRPDLIANGLAAPALHSYPSGHAALSLVVYGFLAYLWMRGSSNWLERTLALAMLLVWMFLVSTSRIVLGSHWPSDIFAGLLIGLVWLLWVIAALRRAEAPASRPRSERC